jgi:hypothetical protein
VRRYLPLFCLLAQCTSELPARPAPDTRNARAVQGVRRDLARASQGLRTSVRNGGLTHVQVESGFRHATIVMRQPDGTRRVRCVDQPEQAARMLLEGTE